MKTVIDYLDFLRAAAARERCRLKLKTDLNELTEREMRAMIDDNEDQVILDKFLMPYWN